jgi:hypothetical protein
MKQRFPEHTRYIQNKNSQSAYDNHTCIVQHAYEFGPIQNIVTVLHRASMERLVDILEQFLRNITVNIHILIREKVTG